MSPYAAKTQVPVERTKAEIERALTNWGATGFMSGWKGATVHLGFRIKDRLVQIELAMPREGDFRSVDAHAQEVRRRWRALLLVVKAKIESVESGVESFDEAWLSHICIPGGTVGAQIIPALAETYKTGKALPMLGSGL